MKKKIHFRFTSISDRKGLGVTPLFSTYTSRFSGKLPHLARFILVSSKKFPPVSPEIVKRISK